MISQISVFEEEHLFIVFILFYFIWPAFCLAMVLNIMFVYWFLYIFLEHEMSEMYQAEF